MQKNKGNTAIPDARIAKVFNFTSEDLAANRLGFITGEQKWQIPLRLRPIAKALFSLLPSRQRDNVNHMSGKLSLNADYAFSEWAYSLRISGYTLAIKINETQDQLLKANEGKIHALYYIFNFDKSRIVAIEMANHVS